MTMTMILVFCALVLTACDPDSVSGIQIASCADACAKSHRAMLRCTDKECSCELPRGADAGAP